MISYVIFFIFSKYLKRISILLVIGISNEIWICVFNIFWLIFLRYLVLHLCISSKGWDVESEVCALITGISKTHRVVLEKISIGNNVEVCCECMNCIRGVRTQNKRKGEKCDCVSYFLLYSINWYSVPSCIRGKFKAQTESRINNRVAVWSYLVNIYKK